jgi:hypothetical protein
MKKEVNFFYINKKGGLSSMAMFLSPFTWNAMVLGHEMWAPSSPRIVIG